MKLTFKDSGAYLQGCSGVGTRGNGVAVPFFGVRTRSHTFLH